jgi:hypothetical protein
MYRRRPVGPLLARAFTPAPGLYSPELLLARAFTHQGFYSPGLLLARAFTRQGFYSPGLLLARAFTRQGYYSPVLLLARQHVHLICRLIDFNDVPILVHRASRPRASSLGPGTELEVQESLQ